MKIVLAVAALIAPVLPIGTASAVAQQTGRVPTAPSPHAPTSAPPAVTATPSVPPVQTRAPQTRASQTGAPQTNRPSTPRTAPRPTQTSILLELETARAGGRIAVAIYRDADTFRRSASPVRTLMLDRDGPVTRAWVLGLPPGRYAIAAFQDADGDGKLSTGSFRIPREPFGFSNGARGRFGPPTFDAASFDLTLGGTTQRVVLGGLIR